MEDLVMLEEEEEQERKEAEARAGRSSWTA
jgi:hypothetical protein